MNRTLGVSQASRNHERTISASYFPDSREAPQSLSDLHPQVKRFYERYQEFYRKNSPDKEAENADYSGRKQ
ncbi:MAG: hypothetical protein AABY16_02155 [Nanoarchaeota archaeon]